MTIYEIDSLESGECRAIRHPFVETMMPTGRMGWTRPAGDWLPLEQAAAIVDSLVAGGVEKLFPAA